MTSRQTLWLYHSQSTSGNSCRRKRAINLIIRLIISSVYHCRSKTLNSAVTFCMQALFQLDLVQCSCLTGTWSVEGVLFELTLNHLISISSTDIPKMRRIIQNMQTRCLYVHEVKHILMTLHLHMWCGFSQRSVHCHRNHSGLQY